MADYMATMEWTKGTLSPSWTVTVQKKTKAALDITGATFAGKLHRVGSSTASDLTGGGTYAISDATNGIFTYAPVAADVATAGNWIWDTKITISSKPIHVLVLVTIKETYA